MEDAARDFNGYIHKIMSFAHNDDPNRIYREVC
jgi:hypothetical protein